MSRIITDGKKLQGEAMPGILRSAQKELVGRTIKAVGYIQHEPGETPSPCLIMDNDTIVVAQSDDEGNGPGVLLVSGNAPDVTILCQTEAK